MICFWLIHFLMAVTQFPIQSLKLSSRNSNCTILLDFSFQALSHRMLFYPIIHPRRFFFAVKTADL
jgi:hypothetical protein